MAYPDRAWWSRAADIPRLDLGIITGFAARLVGCESPGQPHATQQGTYRPDIDGLRAVAILAVLGYHFQHAGLLGGGYVGVDVFFVISGFLIGSIIVGDLRRGTFSPVRFYARRIRRLAPALAVMLLGGFLAGYAFLPPYEFAKYARSALSAALSVSNFYFLAQTGYFAPIDRSTPLLHTWSLSVEEQFYLMFPLAMLCLYRFAPRRLTAGVVAMMVCSFGLSAWITPIDAASAFFLAPLRAWELLLGTLVAMRPWTTRHGTWARNLMALAGLALIAVAIRTYTVETPFPGVAALVPCLGAALIIAAGQSGPSLVGRLLSLRPVVFVGLISYSLYLWHWPILVFGWTGVTPISRYSPIVRLVLCLAVATLSWKFVEQPFRKSGPATRMSTAFAGWGAAMGAIVVLALIVMSLQGIPARFSPLANRYAAYLDYSHAHLRDGTCFIDKPATFADFNGRQCLAQDSSRQNYLLLGDSVAAHLWYGLSQLMPQVNILQATAAACPPQLDAPVRRDICTDMMNYVLNDYLSNHHVDRLLIAARWAEKDLPYLQPVLALAAARRIPVTLFGPMVEYDLALPWVLIGALQTGDQDAVRRHLVDQREIEAQVRDIALANHADYISLYGLLCAEGACTTLAPDGSPLQFDADHLTKAGSLLVVRRLIDTGQLY